MYIKFTQTVRSRSRGQDLRNVDSIFTAVAFDTLQPVFLLASETDYIKMQKITWSPELCPAPRWGLTVLTLKFTRASHPPHPSPKFTGGQILQNLPSIVDRSRV